MDHPILSIEEFVRHFRYRAEEFGFDFVEMLDLQPTEREEWQSVRAAFGVVLNGEIVVGNRWETQIRCTSEEFDVNEADGLFVMAGPQGARVVIARRGPLTDWSGVD